MVSLVACNILVGRTGCDIEVDETIASHDD
jgi:hypothetical protein